jgi:ABC-type Fe3+/spermidine/putrescine transport system ATPase subunit
MGFRNIFEGKLIRSGDGQSVIGLLGAEITIKSPPVSSAAQSIVVAIRPQKLRISQRSPAGSNFVHGELASVSYHGSSTLYEVNVRGTSVFVQETDRTVACDELRVGGPAVVSWEPEAAQIFSR